MKIAYPSLDSPRSSQPVPPRDKDTSTATTVPVGRVDDKVLSLDPDAVPSRETANAASPVNSEKAQDVEGTHCGNERKTVGAEPNSATVQHSASPSTSHNIPAPASELVAKGIASGDTTILAGETPPSQPLRRSPTASTVELNVATTENSPPELAPSFDQVPCGGSTESKNPDTGTTRPSTSTTTNTLASVTAIQDSNAHATPPAMEIRPVASSNTSISSPRSTNPVLSGASGNDRPLPNVHESVDAGTPGTSDTSNDPFSTAHPISAANTVPADGSQSPHASPSAPNTSSSGQFGTVEESAFADSQEPPQARKVFNPFLPEMSAAEAGYVTDTVQFVERTAGEKEKEKPQLKLQYLREDVEEVVNLWAGLDRSMGYPASNVSNLCV